MKFLKNRFWGLALLMTLVLTFFGSEAFARGGRGGFGGGSRGGTGGTGGTGGVGGRGSNRGGSGRGGRGGNSTQTSSKRKEEQARQRREERVRRVTEARLIYAKRERQQLWDAEAIMADGVTLGRIFDGVTE